MCLLIAGAAAVVFCDRSKVGAYGRVGEPDAVYMASSEKISAPALVLEAPAIDGQIVKVGGPDPMTLAEFDAKIARADKSRHRARAEKYRAQRAAYVAACH